MSTFENSATIGTPSPSAVIAFRRQSIEGDEENEPPRMILPSPRREPLRVLRRNNNSKDSLLEILPGSAKDDSKPPLVTKQRSERESFGGRNERTPLKTPSSKKTLSSPFTGGKTPNEGKILSPLPLQPRKLHTAKKKPVKIDTDEFLSSAPSVPTPTKDGTNDESCTAGDGSSLMDLKISNPFDDDDSCGDDSLGWAYTLEDFQFIRKLGSGGSADVFEVLEKGTCAMYALKVQPATEDAMCELDLHIPLKHQNICQMFDYFYSDTKPFAEHEHNYESIDRGEDPTTTRYLCTMLEVCDHGDIHDLIDEHCVVPEDIAAKAILEAIRALQYLHSKDMIHCDIKPANLLIDGEDDSAVIKLADFGMAVTGDAKEVVGGSPVYMAPEHLVAWRNLTDDFDHRTDIYSLGVVLYEMLMGYLPYEVIEANQSKGPQNTETGDFEESIVREFLGLSVADPSTENPSEENFDHGYPVLDLRKLNDVTSEEPFYIPPPIFVEEISQEAQDLILRLMEPSVSKRITLEEAQDHEWFRKVL